MDAELRKVLSKLVLGIRHLLEGYYDNRGVWHAGDLEQRLNQLGVWRDRLAKPLEELPQLSETDNKARRTVDAYIKYREETGIARAEAVEEFIRESAYTWFNRLFALRCMEARSIIDEVIHQKDIYGGRSLQHNRLAIRHPELCAGEDDGLFAVLFQEFKRRAHELPFLFNPESPAIALRPSVSIVKRLISMLSGRESVNGDYVSDKAFMAPDAFGWAYQYWNAEEKDRVFERVRTEKTKIEGKDIIPVTCIYTEPYMVKFLVQNSLGAQWCCMYPESRLHKVWEYYIKDADRSPVEEKPVREITFLDPACGSGHFLLEAFDLFYDMYKEEGELTTTEEICASILENNLYGIDIDERAVQISVAVLWMKVKERAPELDTSKPISYQNHFIATNIRLPKGKDHLEEFLRKHPEDRPLKSALISIFEALENVNEIGSLLKIIGPLERAFDVMRTDYGIQATLWTNGFTSLDSWRETVFMQLKEHFNVETISSDLSHAFFGQSVNKGLRLIDILSSKYDVIATNPPYMGSGNLGDVVKEYTREYYYSGRSDLYACFILRCFDLSKINGHIGMVTQQSWLFLRSYSELRASNFDGNIYKKGILSQKNIELFMHLGHGAFEEISGEVVNVVLSIFFNSKPKDDHTIVAYRLLSTKSSKEKEILLLNTIIGKNNELIYNKLQKRFLTLEQTPICYWIGDNLLKLLQGETLRKYADVVQGLATANDNRFVRYHWEVHQNSSSRWHLFEKGGGYGRWAGHNFWSVDYELKGVRIKNTPSPRLQNTSFYFKDGWTYSDFAGGSIGPRKISKSIFSTVSPAAIIREKAPIGAILYSRINSYLIRSISAQTNHLRESYMRRLPVPNDFSKLLYKLEDVCVNLMCRLKSYNILEYNYMPTLTSRNNVDFHTISMLLHTLEGFLDSILFDDYCLSEKDIKEVIDETGTPVGWYPLLSQYNDFSLSNYEIPNEKELKENLTKLELLDLNKNTMLTLKENLKMMFEYYDPDQNKFKLEKNYEKYPIGRLPIPAETFLEKLSQKLQIHPISVYLLLKEGIEQEGWRCLPEKRRILENRLTVLILQLLGHQWPVQIESGELMPNWADPDGIIPLTRGTNESILLDRIRQRINEDFEDDRLIGERGFEELMGESLEAWLLDDFFEHHQSQFKKRPVAWQIQSIPSGSFRRGRKRSVEPAFSCLVYCQNVDGDTLHKIRTQYVGPLKNGYEAELRTLETIGLLNTEQTVRRTKLEMQIDELEEFDAKLQRVINEGFDSKDLEKLVRDEPLDSWCSIDGKESPPDSYEGLYLQERAYIPDVNDGVRVNIVPLQKAGLLASDVLALKDVERAISDRAEWRADERRWCREGKLPQPGWWKKEEAE